MQTTSSQVLHSVAGVPKGAHGGMVTPHAIIPGYAAGGAVPGFSPGVDSILAALSPR